MQATNSRAVIGIRKSDIGNDRIDMNTHPFMYSLAILMQIFNELHFIGAAGESLLQQGGDLGVIFRGEFGFAPCAQPLCPFDKKNAHFLSIRNNPSSQFTVGYEPEFQSRAEGDCADGGSRVLRNTIQGRKWHR